VQSRYVVPMHADAARRSDPERGNSAPPEPKAYTIPAAAKALSIGERKMAELIANGEIESVKIGRARRIPRAALDEYLRSLSGVA
jgi:excisionase family DNA binding protein